MLSAQVVRESDLRAAHGTVAADLQMVALAEQAPPMEPLTVAVVLVRQVVSQDALVVVVLSSFGI